MNRLEELIGRFLDDGLTREEQAELKDALNVDLKGADQLLGYYQQDRLLPALFRPSSADAVNAILAAVTGEDSFVDCVMREARADAMDNALVHHTETRPCTLAAAAESIEPPTAMPFKDWIYRLFASLRWASAVAGVLLIGLVLWLYLPLKGVPTLAIGAGTRVALERAGQSFAAQDGLKLLPGDLLQISGSNGVAIAYGEENTGLELKDDAELKILPWNNGKRFELRHGKIEAVVARQRPWNPMVLTTAQAEARVLGTKFTLAAGTNATQLDVTEGKVQFTRSSDKATVKVGVGQFAIAAAGYELTAQPLPGKVFREFWLNLPGDTLQDLTYDARYPNAPSGHDAPPNFETSTNWPSPFGTRTRAYLLPPLSGDYEFRISGNGQVCLWLSPDGEAVDRVKIAQILFTRNRPGDMKPEDTPARQESGPIPLVAGRRYYIEATHKYGSGEDRLSVTWKRADGTEEPIPAEVLAPFVADRKRAK